MKRLRNGITGMAVLVMAIIGGNRLADARISSPGNVVFSNQNALNTNAVFDSSGTYVLQLSVFDGSKTTLVTTTITVNNFLPKLAVSTSSAISGNGVDVPVVFSTGTIGVSSLQFDLLYAAALSSPTVITGSAATAAGKSAQINPITGGSRVLVFGVNQTIIGQGQIAIVNLRLDPTLISSTQTLTIVGIVGSDPAGVNVPMTGTNGSIIVTANKAPIVSVLPLTQTITFPVNSVTLTGSATDDIAPNPPGILTYNWTVL